MNSRMSARLTYSQGFRLCTYFVLLVLFVLLIDPISFIIVMSSFKNIEAHEDLKGSVEVRTRRIAVARSTFWILSTSVPLMLAGCGGAFARQLTVLSVTLGIFLATLSLNQIHSRAKR